MKPETDWQTWATLAVVLITIGAFVARSLRAKKTGCGGGCGCETKKKPKLPWAEK